MPASGSKLTLLLSAVLLCGAAAWGVKQIAAPTYVKCPACKGVPVLSCGAPGCDHGVVPCDGPCLKPDSPGWQKLDVAGHSPDELWMRFDNDDGRWVAFAHGHIGEVVAKKDGKWVLAGKCPVCAGSLKKACPACEGRKMCERCGGRGEIRRWL